MAAVLRVSQCRVRVPQSHVVDLIISLNGIMPTLPTTGDVSLSGEDKPPNYFIYRPPAVQLQPVPSMDHRDRIPCDMEDDDTDDDDDGLLQEHHNVEEDHHSWLGGTTALKFLAAGGVAGTGQSYTTHPMTTDFV